MNRFDTLLKNGKALSLFKLITLTNVVPSKACEMVNIRYDNFIVNKIINYYSHIEYEIFKDKEKLKAEFNKRPTKEESYTDFYRFAEVEKYTITRMSKATI